MSRNLSRMTFVSAAIAACTLHTAQAAIIQWDRGGGNNALATATNWDGDVAPGPADQAEFKLSAATTAGYNVNTAVLNYGALKVNAFQTAFWNVNSTVVTGNTVGTLIFDGITVDSYANAAVVNVSGQGGGIRSNVTLNGGGDFFLVHNSSSGFEIDGIVTETNGAAGLIADGFGTNATGNNRIHIRGNNTTAPQVYNLTGDIVVQNGANLRIEDGFDISVYGSTLTIDGTSKFNLGPAVNYTVAGLTVNGNVFAPGVYDVNDFNAAGVGQRFENASATITVVELVPEPASGLLAVSALALVVARARRIIA